MGMGNYDANKLNFKPVNAYIGKESDTNINTFKESKLNMAVLELQRADNVLQILDNVRDEIFSNNYETIIPYKNQLKKLFFMWSGMLNEKQKDEYKKEFEKFEIEYGNAIWNLENGNKTAYEQSCQDSIKILEELDLKMMDLKQKLKMGMPTQETYTINEKVFKDLEMNRNLGKIILKRFIYDKKYENEFKKWAEEDSSKKKKIPEEDDEFNEFDEDESEE